MRVVEPHEFKGVKHPKKKRKGHNGIKLAFVIVAFCYVLISLLRPIPALTVNDKELKNGSAEQVTIKWPTYGQSAAGIVGHGTVGTEGESKPLPTASVAKVMTALAVLKRRPLAVGQQGPTLTMTQADVDEYARTVAMDGSNVPVAVGEEITQYQALQALLLPSANNMAHSLVRWAYGSDEEYLQFVNNFAKSLGMENTEFADASGYSAKTVSTAQDLVKLAVNAMDNPVIAEIVAQPEATIPVAGRIHNVNALLGRNGIVGVKTGNTDQAGGCFMAAASRDIGGHKVTAVSVIMGAPNLYTALRDSVPLVNSILDGVQVDTVAKAGEAVGEYVTDWGEKVNLVAKQDVTGIRWRGETVKPNITLNTDVRVPLSKDQVVGKIEAQFGRDVVSSDVLVDRPVNEPGLLWRLKPRAL